MDAEDERYMEVLERPPELQATQQSAFFTLHSRTPILIAVSIFLHPAILTILQLFFFPKRGFGF